MKYLIILLLLFVPVLRATTLPSSTTYHVHLTWIAPTTQTDPVTGYYVYRSISGKNAFLTLNQNQVVATSYDDLALLYGVSYDYYVTSADANGTQSIPSNTITMIIPFVPYSPVLKVITQ